MKRLPIIKESKFRHVEKYLLPFRAENVFMKIYIIICILIITASFKKEVDQEEKRTF